MRTIEFIDGNTGEVVDRTPFEEVPKPNREVYIYEDGTMGAYREGCTVVPIARVVKLALDQDGNPVANELAQRIVIEEYDDSGKLLRTNTMLRRS